MDGPFMGSEPLSATALISVSLASRPLLDRWKDPSPTTNEHRAGSGWGCKTDNQQAQDL